MAIQGKAVDFNISAPEATAKNDTTTGTIYFVPTDSTKGKIYVGGVNYSGEGSEGGDDVLDAAITTTKDVGNVKSGSTFDSGTSVKSILNTILAYKSPSISISNVKVGDETANSNLNSNNEFVTGNTLNLYGFTYTVTNSSSLKSGSLSIKINNEDFVNPSESSKTYNKLTKTVSSNSDGNGVSISITGKDTLGNTVLASFSKKYYLPIYYQVTSTPTSGTPDKINTVYALTSGTNGINMTNNYTSGQYFCIYLPSVWNKNSVLMGTLADFGFGIQQTITKDSETLTIDSNDYNIFKFQVNSAQSSLTLKTKF